jgi:cytochrome c peroxidase
LGDDGRSIGDRNTPSAAYASLTPKFHVDAKGKPTGGLFWDGRAPTLESQAGGPPLNPIEMGMASETDVVARLKENADYVAAFQGLYGKDVLSDDKTAYEAMAKSLAAFERTEFFAPFDSKYDRFLRGEEKLTDQEELGRVLFFSNQFTNCSRCHKLNTFGGAEREPFTNFQYHNIGTPKNESVRALNGKGASHVDGGLQENTAASDAGHAGKFRVPGLRNVAVTAPYMHNGVFKDLRTVVKFYNKYNSKNPKHQIDPETGQPWAAPEVPGTISREELEEGSALDSRRVDALVAFLKTLTDKRYEPLLEQQQSKARAGKP